MLCVAVTNSCGGGSDGGGGGGLMMDTSVAVDKNVLGIDGCTGMVTKGVDGCNDVTSRMRIVDDGANRIRIIDHEI